MDRNLLQKHIFATYVTLRYGMAALALAFPILLYALGKFKGIDLENSMSHYYFSIAPDDATKKIFPMRPWFVGFLFAIGSAAYLYKGFSVKENNALNVAGVCAIGVAVFPMDPNCAANCMFSLHGTFAVLLFLCIAYVSIACAEDTLRFVQDETKRKHFRRVYKTLGVLMIVSPVTAFLLSAFFQDYKKYIFFIEAAGVCAFALYWWKKSDEMSLSGADKRALSAEIET